MKKLVKALAICSAMHASNNLLAVPNFDDKQGLSTGLVEVYADDANDPQAQSLTFYQMPSKLVVDENKFTGQRTFSWTALPDGTALVRMSVAAFSDPLLSLQTLKDLNRTYKKRILFKPFNIKDLSLKQEGDQDLIKSTSVSVDSGTTQGTFSISFRLTEVGVSVWQALIQSGGLITNPNLTFKVQFTNDQGQLFWEERTLALEVSDLPDPTVSSHDATPYIETWAAYQGELTYWSQFAECGAIHRGQEFIPPSAAQLDPPNSGMTAAEAALFAEKAKQGFHTEKARVLASCEPEIQNYKADDWWKTYIRSKNIAECRSAVPSWPEVFYLISAQSQVFIRQVERQWRELSDFCGKPLELFKFHAVMESGCLKELHFLFNEEVLQYDLLANTTIYVSSNPVFKYNSFVAEPRNNGGIVLKPVSNFCNSYFDELRINSALKGENGRQLGREIIQKLNYASQN